MSNITKVPVPTSTITRDLREFDVNTDNIYESIVIISKRANQIAVDIKEELHGKLAEFATVNDNLELLSKFKNNATINISKIEDEEVNELEVCKVPKQVVYIYTDVELKQHEILRRSKNEEL